MGSSTKTVTGVGYSKMFDETHEDLDLMIRKISTEYAASKTIDPAFLTPSLLQIRRNFSPVLLEKLQITSIGGGSSLAHSDSALLLAVQAIDPTATNIESYIEDVYGCNNKRIDAFMYEEWGLPVSDCPSPGVTQVWNVDGTEYTYINYDCTATDVNGDTVTEVGLGLCGDTSPTVTTTFPSVTSSTYTVFYDGGKHVVVFKDDTFFSEFADEHYMTIDYKLDGEVNVEKFITIANTIMGMSNGVLDDTLADENLEDFFMTYSTAYGVNPDYDAKIDQLMGTDGYIVEWGTNIVKYGFEILVEGEDPVHTMELNGVKLVVTEDIVVQFMLPLEWLEKRTMREQYDDLKELSTFFAFTSQEVKVAWYQTGFFRILMWVVAIVAAYYGYYNMLVGMITSEVIQRLFPDSVIGDVISLVISLYTLQAGYSLLTNADKFSTVLQVASKASSVYVKYEMNGIKEEMTDLTEQQKATDEVLKGMKREAIYSPLDTQDMVYDAMYENVYKMYTQAYNFDSYYSLRIKPYVV